MNLDTKLIESAMPYLRDLSPVAKLAVALFLLEKLAAITPGGATDAILEELRKT